jgi:hypothetical protein
MAALRPSCAPSRGLKKSMNDRIHRSEADDDTKAARSAEAIVTRWQALCAALTPVIGERGTAAIFKRSIGLAGAAYPWMVVTQNGIDSKIDPAQLKSLLIQHTPADIAAMGVALEHALRELLASLIGSSLTARLLRSVVGADRELTHL